MHSGCHIVTETHVGQSISTVCAQVDGRSRNVAEEFWSTVPKKTFLSS